VYAEWRLAATEAESRIVGKPSFIDKGRIARYPRTFKEDRLEERLSRTSSKTTPKPPMRAVDTLNLFGHELWRPDKTP